MSGHGIVWNVESSGNLAGRKAIGLLSHQQAECVEPRWLGQRRKGFNREVMFHVSGLIDMIYDGQVTAWPLVLVSMGSATWLGAVKTPEQARIRPGSTKP